MKKSKRENPVFDGALIGLLAVVVVIMVVRLSPWMLDLLIAINLAGSLVILCASLFVTSPVKFNTFPTLLLLATIYRLALNISSTRMILTSADAGRIISGFGGSVAGGDIIVGAVIFAIIMMVLFLVITKGAERVAEVSARFTLDALPGMQQAIESDYRAGALSALELRHRRSELEQHSLFYGSLDGAMKFIRGDAIAAVVIAATNIFGGVAIGVLRHGLGWSGALDTYGQLAIGDGLVSMIPALLISTAAGLLVTRAGQGKRSGSLGRNVALQVAEHPWVLFAGAGLMGLVGVVPGLPAWPFFVVAALLFAGGVAAARWSLVDDAPALQPMMLSGISVTVDEMQAHLDELLERRPVLVRTVIPERISVPLLCDLFGALQQDGWGVDVLPDVLEVLTRVPVGLDRDALLERIRARMVAPVVRALVDADTPLPVAIIDGATQYALEESLVPTMDGRDLALGADEVAHFREQLQSLDETLGVLLTNSLLREPLRRLVTSWRPELLVLTPAELGDEQPIEPRAVLSL